jgi:hypothetical protein
VENVVCRIKKWKVMEWWKGDRHDFGFFGDCLGIICGLINIETNYAKPVRANLRTLRPSVAKERGAAKKRREAEIEDEEEEEDVEDEKDEEDEETKEAEAEHGWYEIEKIIRHKHDKDYGRMYLIKYLTGEQLWVTPNHITQDAIRDYHVRRGMMTTT